MLLLLLLQVGNVTEDELYWTRPENMNSPRPFFYLPVSQGASDLLGSLIGAFASSSTLFRTLDPVYYNQLLAMAQALYGVMISAPARLTDCRVQGLKYEPVYPKAAFRMPPEPTFTLAPAIPTPLHRVEATWALRQDTQRPAWHVQVPATKDTTRLAS